MRIRLSPIASLVCLLAATLVAAAEPAPPQPDEAQVIDRTRRLLSRHFDSRFDLHLSDHFVVLHDGVPDHVAARARLLEKTHRHFYRLFGDTGFQVQDLGSRLMCVVFANRDEFTRYAEKVDWIDMSWSGGYYSSRTNRVALYQIQGWRYDESEPEAADHHHDTRSGDPSASATPRPNHASTTHEAAHQLAFNSGLQRRGVMYPLWVSEGLATAFETVSLKDEPDITTGNPARRRHLIEARDNDLIMPLSEFVSLTRVPTEDPERINAVYGQAWKLFTYLFVHEREGLIQYMSSLARLRPGHRTGSTMRAEFIAAFGPLDELEIRWQQHLRDFQ